jgi:signal transduction histidine kinase
MEKTEFCDRPTIEANDERWTLTSSSGRAPDVTDTDFLATLVAIAGHDLRQPLQLVRSAHNVLAAQLCTDEQWRELSAAEAAVVQLVGMLDQLVEAVQLHECSRQALQVPISLSPILHRLALELERSARSKGIVFRVNETRSSVFSHPVLLTSLLRNLIQNAINYTPCGGFVFVTCEERGRELHIHVCDTGSGIDANALATVFSAFQRVDSSRADGLGLGLFIVKRAAELPGHRIEVRSAEGYGSRFTVVARAIPWRRGRPKTNPSHELDLTTLPDITEFVTRGQIETSSNPT